ncbi:MAG: bifunctional 4-hydroxy-2-oxoglutarate aldolase/2-dehydro-3-deoxy-phosphogluconate aldolase, partial [Planctomycetota bacterium]
SAVRPAIDAAIAGGFRVVELTLTTPDCFDHIADLSRRQDLVVGAGTILGVEHAKQAMAAGARFLVSPVFDAQVVAFCRQHDLLSIPGTYTPSEMMQAHKAGADLVKLFPGPGNGPAFVKAVLGPMPFLKIFPTSGVTEDNAQQWLAAGSFGCGFVNTLFEPKDLEAGDFEAVRARAARMVASVRAATGATPLARAGEAVV